MSNLSRIFSSLVSTDGPLSNMNHNLVKEFEVVQPPDDTVTCMAFSPASITQANYLIAGSWDNNVRCWEIQSTGSSIPVKQQSMTASVLDVAWSDDGSKVFMAGCDNMAKCWDVSSNQCIQVAAHEAPVKTCHWIHTPKFNCLMTGSFDKTVKFWDLRAQQPILTLQLPEKVHCADVDGPIAVVSTAGRQIISYRLDDNPPLRSKIQLKNPLESEHRCISIFRNKQGETSGLAVGSFGGQVAIHKFHTVNPMMDNFEIKCHLSKSVNDIKFQPKHGTMATAGSDGSFAFWDIDKPRNIMTSPKIQQPVTSCCFNHDGQIFAYSVGYDWSKGAVGFSNPEQKKSHIFLRPSMEEIKPLTSRLLSKSPREEEKRSLTEASSSGSRLPIKSPSGEGNGSTRPTRSVGDRQESLVQMIPPRGESTRISNLPSTSPTEEDDKKAMRLKRFAGDIQESKVKMVDALGSDEIPSKEQFGGKRLTILELSEHQVAARQLDQRVEDLGWWNWDLLDPFLFAVTRGLWDFIQPKLYPGSADAPMLEMIENLNDLKTLADQEEFGDNTNPLFPLAIEWGKALKHALAKNDIIYLLQYGHFCLSALVIISNMIGRPDLRITALQLLYSAGFSERCDLPTEIPLVYPYYDEEEEDHGYGYDDGRM